MSFILDALKKSESDRQRQAGPSLFEVKVAAPRRKLPLWAAAIVVLLGVNMAVVSWMLLRRPARPSAAAATTAAPAATTSASAAAAMAPGATPAIASESPAPAPAAAAPPDVGTVHFEDDAGAASKSPAAATPGSAAPAPAGGPDLPLYQQVESAPGSTLPALHLDLHVYATDPRNRYVMINMHRLQEGDSLPDGVQVLAIRPDGVVLSYRGSQFLLPRD
jgi:general secretion pathway protein B